jgi:hypothetical protein
MRGSGEKRGRESAAMAPCVRRRDRLRAGGAPEMQESEVSQPQFIRRCNMGRALAAAAEYRLTPLPLRRDWRKQRTIWLVDPEAMLGRSR